MLMYTLNDSGISEPSDLQLFAVLLTNATHERKLYIKQIAPNFSDNIIAWEWKPSTGETVPSTEPIRLGARRDNPP